MAKPLLELMKDLSSAIEKAEADKAVADKASAEAQAKLKVAEAAYKTAVDAANASQSAAAKKSAESSAVVKSLQDELNTQLGRFDSRVRVG